MKLKTKYEVVESRGKSFENEKSEFISGISKIMRENH
jgi:hypothetical protein